MLEPILPNPIIASAYSGSVERAGASEQQCQMKDSVQRHCKMAGNSRSPMYRTYLLMSVFQYIECRLISILTRFQGLAA
jgi:hypothetical protein